MPPARKVVRQLAVGRVRLALGGPTHDRKREVEERDWQQPRKGSIAIQSVRIDLFARSSATRIEQDHPIRGKDDKVIARLIHDIQNA
jgi:hypothetical protein